MKPAPGDGAPDTGAAAHLNLALEHLPGGFTCIDRDLRYVLVNPGYARLFDYPEGLVAPGRAIVDELRYQAERGDFGEDDADTAIEDLLDGLRNPRARSYERHLPTGRILQVRVAPIPGGGCVQIVTDVTDQKRLESELALKSTIERRILDAIDQGIVMVDADLRIAAINRRFLDMFDLPAGLLDERPDFRDLLRRWFRENGNDEARLERAIEYLALRDAAVFEQPLPDGRVIAVQHLPQEEGVFLRTFTDITERVESHRRIEESARRFQTVIDQLPSALCVRDSQGRTEMANVRFREWFVAPGTEVAGQTVFDLFPREIAEGLRATEEQVLREQRTVEKEVVQPFADGSIHTTLVSKFPIRDADGVVAAVGTVESDFTERKNAERALRESEERFRTLLDTSPIGATMVAGDGSFEFVNSRLAEMLGMSREQVLASRARDFYVDPAERDAVNERLLAEGRLRDVEIRMQRADGTPFWILLSFEPVPGAPGQFFGWVYDIDALKRAEGLLAEKTRQLDVALESMQDGLTMLDGDLNYIACNSAYREIVGAPEAMLRPGEPVENVLRHSVAAGHYGDVDAEAFVRKRLEEFRRAKGVATFRVDGDRVIETRRSRTPDGGMVSVLRDVTEQRRLEESLRAARDQATQALADLERAQQDLVQAEKMASLGQLTAGIAHEIKNPLNFVNNFSETSVELLDELGEVLAPLRDGMDDGTREQVDELLGMLGSDMGKIASHGKRADSIMRKMLLHARDQGDAKTETDVNALVAESIKLAYHGERARHPGFNVELPTTLEPAAGAIEALQEELTRVLVNLLSNSFDATRARAAAARGDYAPTVEVTTFDRGEEVEIRVRDNGAGIPEHVQEKIFDPFFTTKPAGEGTGLGLSLSYDVVVKQHGGRMEVDSGAGEFTEFRIHLPRADRGAGEP